MSFRWNPQFPSEWEVPEPPSIWVYFLLYLIIEGMALAMVVPGLPKFGSLPWDRLLRYAGAVPFFAWLALSSAVFWFAYDIPATLAAEHNAARWHEITGWQRQSRSGVVVLDSAILTPEPDLAVRMLGLEGEAPDNPGRVMAIEAMGATDAPRVQRVLTQLLTPLRPRLAQAMRSDSFDIVTQAEGVELAAQVQEVWKQLELPGTPRIGSLGIGTDPGLAEHWFEEDAQPLYSYAPYHGDRTPKYRLLLAWHLNEEGLDVEHKHSEAAVALLLGSPALMYGKPDIKHQAWLLREITGEPDQVDRSLTSLLKAGQVQVERIRHFWHSGLKGLAQHATLGAVRESGLKLEEHALDQAIGPQAPVVRWVSQALAAKMAQFGQGAQLVALPHEQGVALNVVAKEPAPVDVPWKDEYGYKLLVGPECCAFVSLWMVNVLLSPDKDWSTTDTLITCLTVLVTLVFFFRRHPGLFSRLVESTVDFVAGMIGF